MLTICMLEEDVEGLGGKISILFGFFVCLFIWLAQWITGGKASGNKGNGR